MQKSAKSTFRPRAKYKKREKLRFAHGRNAENGKIYVSPTGEMQKTAKSAFRPRAKCGNRQKLRFAHGRNAKNSKIYVSSTGEMQKTAKSTFRPRTKCKKQQNLRFRRGKYRHGKRREACEPLRLLKTLPVLEKYIRNRLITIACFFVSACY